MGYWSEYQITWMEREEMLSNEAAWIDHSILPVGFQLLEQLDALKHRLKVLLLWDNLRAFQQGRAIRDWRKVYAEWPDYWSGKKPDELYWPAEKLETVEMVLTVIAGIQERLFFYGIKPDERDTEIVTVPVYDPLEGQLPLQLVA